MIRPQALDYMELDLQSTPSQGMTNNQIQISEISNGSHRPNVQDGGQPLLVLWQWRRHISNDFRCPL